MFTFHIQKLLRHIGYNFRNLCRSEKIGPCFGTGKQYYNLYSGLLHHAAGCLLFVKVFNYARLLDWTKRLRAYNYTHNA